VKITTELAAALAGRYVVEREVGRGGMAVVYLARDTKHDRLVAVKVLNPELTAALGTERFLSEIKTTATLQHPNLLPLFDSGEAHGLLYYVMPYVEGETLRARLEREQQLPVDDAVRIATGIANALAYAHARGVIHRDLKPENVLLHHGQPVVLDFGIALAVRNAVEGRKTQTGISVGTPQYMSPEQAAGEKTIDARADIYALGTLTYEMLAGEPPHTGRSTQAVIAKVMAGDVRPLTALRPSVPVHIASAVQRALSRVPADRFSTAADFARALEHHTGSTPVPELSAPTSVTAPVSQTRGREMVAWAVAVVALGVAIGAWGWLRPGAAERAMTTRFTVDVPAGTQLDNVYAPLTITHDGRTIIFRALLNNTPQLVRRDVDGLSVTPIAGTEGAGHPVVSPDDKWIAFTAGGEVRRVSLAGSPPVKIGGSPQQGLTWATNDLVLESMNGGLYAVSVADGTQRKLLDADPKRGEVAIQWPIVLPDRKTFFYVSWPASGLAGARIGVGSLATGEAKVLDLPGTTPLGVADGQLFYVSTRGVLTAVPFDLRSLTPTGAPRALVDQIDVNTGVGAARVAMADSGTLVYLTGGTTTKLVTLESDGTEKKVLLEQGLITGPVWSPDGKRIAVQTTSPEGKADVGIIDVATGAFARLTGEGNNANPTWSGDGRRIVFNSTRSGSPAFWWQPVDGSGNPEKLVDADRDDAEAVVSPDGRYLVYHRGGAGLARETWLLELIGARPPRRLITAPGGVGTPTISPDGKWIAYTARQATGEGQVYVRPFPDSGAATQISLDGGNYPVWAPDGKTLYFDFRGRFLYAASLAPGKTMGVTARRQLFGERYFAPGATRRPSYSVAPDGKRFVTLARSAGEAKIVVVTNWLAELRRSQRIEAR
jgi:eukaryotic-like serine/threonine-protein kinase